MLNRTSPKAIIFTYGADKQIRTLGLVDPYERPLDKDILPEDRGPQYAREVVLDQFSGSGSAR